MAAGESGEASIIQVKDTAVTKRQEVEAKETSARTL